jgi:nicotinate-nucleotide adenylyltransferase
MPAHTSPFKPAAPDPGPAHRLHMCRLLVAHLQRVSVCELEIERGGASYTVDTLSAIHASHPDAELTFIVGADTASTLPAWREPGRVLALAQLAVAAREGADRAQVLASLAPLGAALRTADGRDPAGGLGVAGTARAASRAPRVRFLEMPVVDVSSSEVRRRVARGEPVDELVGAGVARYIEAQGLYRDAHGAGG